MSRFFPLQETHFFLYSAQLFSMQMIAYYKQHVTNREGSHSVDASWPENVDLKLLKKISSVDFRAGCCRRHSLKAKGCTLPTEYTKFTDMPVIPQHCIYSNVLFPPHFSASLAEDYSRAVYGFYQHTKQVHVSKQKGVKHR